MSMCDCPCETTLNKSKVVATEPVCHIIADPSVGHGMGGVTEVRGQAALCRQDVSGTETPTASTTALLRETFSGGIVTAGPGGEKKNTGESQSHFLDSLKPIG